MYHASNLRRRTLCGLDNLRLPQGDTSLAAISEETQSWVTCKECREKLGLEPLEKD